MRLFVLLLASLSLAATVASANPDLKRAVGALTSEEMAGRHATSLGARSAAAWIARRFRALDLAPPFCGQHIQSFDRSPTNNNHDDKTSFKCNGVRLQKWWNWAPIDLGAGPTSTDGRVRLCGFGERKSDFVSEGRVAPKVALVFLEGGKGTSLLTRAALASLSGVKCLLVCRGPAYLNEIDDVPNRLLSESVKGTPLCLFISNSLAKSILSLYEDAWSKSFESSMRGLHHSVAPGLPIEVRRGIRTSSRGSKVKDWNVGGLVLCPQPIDKALIVVCAHYDHLGRWHDDGLKVPSQLGVTHPGADDNASGVAAILAVARSLRDRASKMHRDVLFVAFGSEEIDRRGSREFSDWLDDSGYTLRQSIILNLDMVGRTPAAGALKIFGTDSVIDLRGIIESERKKLGTTKVVSFTNIDFFLSDHRSFNKCARVLWSTGKATGFYHLPSDAAGSLNWDWLQFNSDLCTRVTECLACRRDSIRWIPNPMDILAELVGAGVERKGSRIVFSDAVGDSDATPQINGTELIAWGTIPTSQLLSDKWALLDELERARRSGRSVILRLRRNEKDETLELDDRRRFLDEWRETQAIKDH